VDKPHACAKKKNRNFPKTVDKQTVDKPHACAKKKNRNFPKTVDKQTVDKLPGQTESWKKRRSADTRPAGTAPCEHRDRRRWAGDSVSTNTVVAYYTTTSC
jgi:hypothetical protein